MSRMLTALIGKQHPLVIHPAIIEMLHNDHLAALFFEQLVYWSDKTSDPDGWVAKTDADWFKELLLTPRQLRRCRDVLLEDSLIMTAVRRSRYYDGQPVLHYQVQWDAVEATVNTYLETLEEGQNGNSRSDKTSLPESDKTSLLGVTKGNAHNTETTSETIQRKKPVAPTGATSDFPVEPSNPSPSKESTPKPKAPPKSKSPKSDESADPAVAARNAGIVALIKSWLDTTGTFSPNPYGNKTFRGAAGMMFDAGVTVADVRDFCWWHQKVDAFWKGKPLPFMKVADGYRAWRAVNQDYHAPSEAALKQAEEDRRAIAEANRAVSDGTPMSATDAIKSLGLTDLANKMTRGEDGR